MIFKGVASQFGVKSHAPQPSPSSYPSGPKHHVPPNVPPQANFSADIPDVTERHPVYFFHDGNVDLICRSDDRRTIFRVHSQRLTQHSPIMFGLLSQDKLHRVSTLDGRPQIPWDDDPVEFTTLMEVLYKQAWVLGPFLDEHFY